MDKATEPPGPGMQGKRRGRGKVRSHVVVEDRIIKASVPAGSRFKGYETYQVQELVLSVHAVRYLRERRVTQDGQTIIAPLPDGTQGHFGPNLRRFVLMQYHQGQSTLPRLAALLQSVPPDAPSLHFVLPANPATKIRGLQPCLWKARRLSRSTLRS
jgi:hypothetical protein